MPANLAAIRRWCELVRPDLVEYIDRLATSNDRSHDAFILLMTTSFEAGRMFQSERPVPGEYDVHAMEGY